MGLLDIFFGDKKHSINEALSKNATIVDVRTQGEFSLGCIKGAINIPLDQLSIKKNKLKKMRQPIIVCCASGSRSATAKMILKSNGITDVLNGGSWVKLQKMKMDN